MNDLPVNIIAHPIMCCQSGSMQTTYYNISEGAESRDSWDSDKQFDNDNAPQPTFYGSDGDARIVLFKEQVVLVNAMAHRTRSDAKVAPSPALNRALVTTDCNYLTDKPNQNAWFRRSALFWRRRTRFEPKHVILLGDGLLSVSSV